VEQLQQRLNLLLLIEFLLLSDLQFHRKVQPLVPSPIPFVPSPIPFLLLLLLLLEKEEDHELKIVVRATTKLFCPQIP